jgi:hypothetical protein
MNEVIENYQLFSVIFITLLIIVFLIYKFLFQIDKEQDYKEYLGSNNQEENFFDDPLDHDRENFQRLKKLLPPAAGSIFFLRNNDMTVVFHKRGLTGLYQFYEGCKNKEYLFKDTTLEELKQALALSIEKYLLTFDTNSKETSRGYFKVEYNIDGLHLLVDELLKNYDRLIASAEKKLL